MSTEILIDDFSLGNFGDKRINVAGTKFFKAICERGISIIKKIALNRAEQVQFNRLIWNDKVSINEIERSAFEKTSKLSENCEHVAVIHDTTELNFDNHKNKIKDLGTVGNDRDIGLFFHPSLAIDVRDNFVLGISAIKYWDRDPNRDRNKINKRKNLPIEEKESYRWIENAIKSKSILGKAKLITHIADRESDFFEFLYMVPDTKNHVIIRSKNDREIIVESDSEEKTDKMVNFFNHSKNKFSFIVSLPARPGKRKKHDAMLDIKYETVYIKRPVYWKMPNTPEKLKITIIDILENSSTVTEGEKPVHWRLLTTHEIKNDEDAKNIIDLYRKRWNIEQLFRTMKSQGIKTEDVQITKKEWLIKMCFLCLLSATKILQLTICRDGKINREANQIFSEKELDCMELLLKKYEGKTQKQKNPFMKRTVAWCYWLIARIGGWKGYTKSEGPAGPITLKEGLEQFDRIYEGWCLAF